MKLNKVVIVGVGLIGGSIGKALLERGIAEEVVGVFRRGSSLEKALAAKAVTKGYVNEYKEALNGADIVFIGTPVDTSKSILEGISEALGDDRVLVTDVGSTKKEIVEYASAYRPNISFVGSHPLAGSEKSGVEYSASDLFEGSLCVLTKSDNTRDEDLGKVKSIWGSLGADVKVVSPDEHDRILAFTSHLPHIVAYILAGVQDKGFMEYTSTGFKDTTRIASSDPELWADIFMSNKDNVAGTIARFREELDIIDEVIRSGDKDKLKKILNEYKRIKDETVQ